MPQGKIVSLRKAVEDRKEQMRAARRSVAAELTRQARRVAAIERQLRTLKAREKELRGQLRIERRFMRALAGMGEDRRPDAMPSALFGESQFDRK